MSISIDEIYQKIAQDIANKIDKRWKSAVMSVELFQDAANFNCSYIDDLSGKEETFKPDPFALDDFENLHNVMNAEGQHDWNRAKFKLYSDGHFDIEFKYDGELAAEIDGLIRADKS